MKKRGERIMFGTDFYPTPHGIVSRMLAKVDTGKISSILEPSAGKGDIADAVKEAWWRCKLRCIEIDENLQSVLQGKGHRVIDSDFLSYSGYDQFDLIIGNPPFSEGAEHLLKAIDILYSGQIVFLLNAETIRKPHTNARKELEQKLSELDAEIEFIANAFRDAERKTGVEIALVYIRKYRDMDTDLLDDCTDTVHDVDIEIEEKREIARRNDIEFLVEEYNAVVMEGLEFIRNFYSQKRIGKYMWIQVNEEETPYLKQFQARINYKVNYFLQSVRKDYWERVLDLKEVKKRMTVDERAKFREAVEKHSDMDFTERNIRAFIIRLVGNYENILNEAVNKLFDIMTKKYHWAEESDKNIHYFNGWKSNKAYYVNKKIVLPVLCRHSSHPFMDFMGRTWRLNGWETEQWLDDIDKVMNYFDIQTEYVSIAEALKAAFENIQTRGIESTYFKISVYKKRTIHLTFRDENILRRFNVCACKNKSWLPPDYGVKEYRNMSPEEKEVVKEFEGEKKYNSTMKQVGFAKKNIQLIAN
jgi:methylase of polypeptide subunit release factors